MSTPEVPLQNLVIAGITDSDIAVVDRVMMMMPNGSHLGTNTSFHHIESFTKFNAEEEKEISPEHVNAPEVSRGTINVPAETTLVRDENAWVTGMRQEHYTVTSRMDGSALQFDRQRDTVDMEKPVASSGQFERQRTASLAAALLCAEREPGSKAFVQFVSPNGSAQVIEAYEEAVDKGEGREMMEPSVEAVIGHLLLTLCSLKMSNPDRHAAAVRRLQDLEEELRVAGAVCPPDTNVSDAVVKALAAASPNSDIQIRVNSSRHTTSKKSVFETETPGMEGLDPATVQRLHQQLISNMSVPTAPPTSTEPTAPTVTDQKHESMAEGFTNEDGSVVVSKKMTRVVTTTRTTIPGEKTESNADLIRLKVNEQVYSGTVDPGDQHIHLVPIIQQHLQRELDSSQHQE